MNRSNVRESLVAGRNFPAVSHHRRGHSLTLTPGISNNRDASAEENGLDLFSKNRRSLSVASSDESSDVSVKLGRLSAGSAKVTRNPIDDLLSSTEGGKHDYDWLLTPPGTPIFPASETGESQPTVAAPRSSSMARSSSTTKASRLSVSQSESNHSARPARSSSVTRSSISTSHYSNYSSNRSSSILNTSSASVSSYVRASSPITRTPSAARASTPSSRPTLSRPSTPSRSRPSPTSSSIDKTRSPVSSSLDKTRSPVSSSLDKTRPGQSSRPSTPSSRPQIPANLSSIASRSNSRPSTPTRRTPVSSLSPASSPSISAGRVLSNGRNATPSSRPSSPASRVRPPPQPIVPPDFPLDTPPNLRTTLPDRPVSAGRSRPGAVSVKGNSESTATSNLNRRHSSPIVSRGRLTEPSGRSRVNSNGHISEVMETRKAQHVPDMSMRKPVKSLTTAAESNGFGRTISKKSLDMAIRHMDIRSGTGNIRQLSGTTLFPQSIRSATQKVQSVRGLSAPASINNNGGLQHNNHEVLENGNNIDRTVENGGESDTGRYSAKLSEVDIYESSRYDAMLLKEDLKNTNWLHSIDDKTDQGPIFDNGFESLPEPFGLL